jgi:hypothetical protein
MHVVQELSFTGEPTFSICDFLCSPMPQAAVHAVDTHPIPLHGRPFKLTERMFVYVQAMISSCNFVHRAQGYETVTVELLFFDLQRMRGLYQEFRPVNQESR